MSRAAFMLSVIALLAGTIVQPVLGASIIESGDSNGDGHYDFWGIDDNGDGVIDRTLLDFGNDGRAEVEIYGQGQVLHVVYIDVNNDGVRDTALQPSWANGAITAWTFWRDADQNNRWENAYFDGNNDRYPEWVLVDTNYDGSADTWQANAAPAGNTATDVIARDVAAVGAFNVLAAGGIPIFGPIASPVGG